MDVKTFSEVHETLPKKMTEEQLKAQIVELNRKLEAYQLVASYAKDVVEYWPSMSFKTIRFMIPKMDALKEALGLVK
jgi:hypothetical protein